VAYVPNLTELRGEMARQNAPLQVDDVGRIAEVD
jgi:hypothetical protein